MEINQSQLSSISYVCLAAHLMSQILDTGEFPSILHNSLFGFDIS